MSQVSMPTSLDSASAARIRALAEEFEQATGAPPLSDQALTQLHSTDVRHVLATSGADGDTIVGYAQQAGTSIEIVADEHTAGALLDALEPLGPDDRIWSHGQRSPISAALSARGMRVVRVLHRLHRRLDEPPPSPRIPDGVRIRPFSTGQDEQAWLALNARAFADHAEQGGWTIDDLRARENESWFDADGFLLADRDGALIGFHWTKDHGGGLGEVYVLGVDPDAQGLGLGAALLAAGLVYLYEAGAREVILYVDDENAGAVRLYERAGFDRADRDVQWKRA